MAMPTQRSRSPARSVIYWPTARTGFGCSGFRCWLSLGARHGTPTCAFILFVGVASALLLLLAHSQFALITTTRIRHFLFIWLFAMTSLAFALTTLRHWLPVAVAFCVLWWLLGAQFGVSRDLGSHYFGTPWMLGRTPPLSAYVAQLRGKVAPDDFLLGFYPDYDVNYLWQAHRRRQSAGLLPRARSWASTAFSCMPARRQYRLASDIRQILDARPHLLLAHEPGEAPPNYPRVREMLDAGYAPCPPLLETPTLHAQKFRHPILTCDREPNPVAYSNGVRLLDRASRYNAATERIETLLWWRLPDEATLDDFNISLQLLSPEGRNLRQIDHHLNAELVPWGPNLFVDR